MTAIKWFRRLATFTVSILSGVLVMDFISKYLNETMTLPLTVIVVFIIFSLIDEIMLKIGRGKRK